MTDAGGMLDGVEVVVAHRESVTLLVGDVYLKVDADQERAGVEVEAMDLAPVPTPQVLWRRPPVVAVSAVRGRALGRLGSYSNPSSAAWAAAGAAARSLHDADLPPWPGPSIDELSARLDTACRWLADNGVLPVDVVGRHRRNAEVALRPWTSVFIHGDLQPAHVFIEEDEVTGVIDWSEASRGDALFDLAILTFGQEAHLADVLAGYGTDVDRATIRSWWSFRGLTAIPWLQEHGYDPSRSGCEMDVLSGF